MFNGLFKYGHKNAVMAFAVIILGIIPLLMVAAVFFQLPETIATNIDSAGEVTRWGGRWTIWLVPLINVGIAVGSMSRAFQMARLQDEEFAAEVTFRRFVRMGLVSAVILNVANLFMLYMALRGAGML